jgi:hypothetical protein
MDWAARIMAVALEMVGFAFGLVAGMWHLIRATRDLGGGRQRRPSEDDPKRG